MIGHFKIGALCMTILDEELNRAQEWKTELDQASKLRGADDQKKLQRRYKSLIKKQDSLFRIGTGTHIFGLLTVTLPYGSMILGGNPFRSTSEPSDVV